jgi:hypothetical protein
VLQQQLMARIRLANALFRAQLFLTPESSTLQVLGLLVGAQAGALLELLGLLVFGGESVYESAVTSL